MWLVVIAVFAQLAALLIAYSVRAVADPLERAGFATDAHGGDPAIARASVEGNRRLDVDQAGRTLAASKALEA